MLDVIEDTKLPTEIYPDFESQISASSIKKAVFWPGTVRVNAVKTNGCIVV